MNKKILVLGGCGAMGTAATRDLAATSDFAEIVIADADVARAEALCQSLGGGRLRALRVDAGDGAALRGLFAGFDLILNCTSYVYGLIVTEAAIAARRPLLDLGGLYNTPKQLAMNQAACEAGVTIVLGMGATPGVTNLMARAGTAHMDQVSEIHIAFATFRPMALSPGLLSTVLDEFSPGTVRFYFQDGEHVRVPPFAGEKEVTFAEPVGRVTTYLVPHSEVHTLPRFINGVRRVDVRGTWRPDIMNALRLYQQIGLLGTDPVAVGDAQVAPKELLRALYQAQGTTGYQGGLSFFLHVDVVGTRGDADVAVSYDLSHPTHEIGAPPPWGAFTTGSVTGIPASIAAQRMARGEVDHLGVLAPEAAFEPRSFFAELQRRDMHITEQVVTRRRAGGTP